MDDDDEEDEDDEFDGEDPFLSLIFPSFCSSSSLEDESLLFFESELELDLFDSFAFVICF